MHKIKDMMHAHQDKKRANEGVNDNDHGHHGGVQVHSKEHIDNIGRAAGAQGNVEVPLLVTDGHGKAVAGIGEVPVLAVRGLDGASMGQTGTSVTDTGAVGSMENIGHGQVGTTGSEVCGQTTGTKRPVLS